MILDFASYNGNSINGSNGTNIVAPPLKWIWYNMNFGATDSSASCVNYFIYKGMDPYLVSDGFDDACTVSPGQPRTCDDSATRALHPRCLSVASR